MNLLINLAVMMQLMLLVIAIKMEVFKTREENMENQINDLRSAIALLQRHEGQYH
jgi:hypothetical protein